MLGATALLWSMTSKLFGGRAAFFAAALFAVLGPTQFLGAFATYDAMALLLLAASAWCVVAARDRDDSTLLLLAGTAAAGAGQRHQVRDGAVRPGGRRPGRAGHRASSAAEAGVARAGYLAAGTPAWSACCWPSAARLRGRRPVHHACPAAGGNSPVLVLGDSWKWAGMVCVLAGVGVIMSLRRSDRGQALILAVFAATGLLAPLNQARIHTTTSLPKHVDFGAWFAAAAAGYAMAQLSRIGQRRSVSLRDGGLARRGHRPARRHSAAHRPPASYRDWPDSARLSPQLRALTREYPGNYLAEDDDVPAYYLREHASPGSDGPTPGTSTTARRAPVGR